MASDTSVEAAAGDTLAERGTSSSSSSGQKGSPSRSRQRVARNVTSPSLVARVRALRSWAQAPSGREARSSSSRLSSAAP